MDKQKKDEIIRDVVVALSVFGVAGHKKRMNILGLYYILNDLNRHKDVSKELFTSFIRSLDQQRLREHLFVIQKDDLLLI